MAYRPPNWKNYTPQQKRAFKQYSSRMRGIGRSTGVNNIQPPNPNPQPPNAAPPPPPVKPATVPAQTVTNAASYTAGQSSNNTPPDPRDEQYYRDKANLLFKKQQEENRLRTEGILSQNNYEEALSSLNRQEPKDKLATKIAASRAGNLFSSTHQEDLGTLQQNYFLQRSDMARTKAQEDIARETARSYLEQGYSLDDAALLAEAADRETARQAAASANTDPGTTTNPTDTLPDYNKLLQDALNALFPPPKKKKPKPKKPKGKK